MSVNGLPVSLFVAWISRSRKLPGLQPDRMLTSCVPFTVPLAVPFAAVSRARVSWISWVSRARSLRRACAGEQPACHCAAHNRLRYHCQPQISHLRWGCKH